MENVFPCTAVPSPLISFVYSAYNFPPPPPPPPDISPSVYKPTQTPLQSCVSPAQGL